MLHRLARAGTRITDEDKMTKMIQLTSPVDGRVYLERPALTLDAARAAVARAKAAQPVCAARARATAACAASGVNAGRSR